MIGLSQSKQVLQAREIKLENMSTLAMMKKFVVAKAGLMLDNIKYAFGMLQLNLKLVII